MRWTWKCNIFSVTRFRPERHACHGMAHKYRGWGCDSGGQLQGISAVLFRQCQCQVVYAKPSTTIGRYVHMSHYTAASPLRDTLHHLDLEGLWCWQALLIQRSISWRVQVTDALPDGLLVPRRLGQVPGKSAVQGSSKGGLRVVLAGTAACPLAW